MKAVRFHRHGEPTEVLHLDELDIPEAGPGRVRGSVEACGLTPGRLGALPRSVRRLPAAGDRTGSLGRVDALGAGVEPVAVGDLVLGVPDYAAGASAGLAQYAILSSWATIPPGLDVVSAAGLPMATKTAFRGLDTLGLANGMTLLVNGAGTMVGFAAVQMALMRGNRVLATAGRTFADRLRAMGVEVTGYGDGLVDRIRDMTSATVDVVFDAAPSGEALPDLVAIADGDPDRVLTVTSFERAEQLGVRTTGRDPDTKLRYDVLDDFARLAAKGRFVVPVAETFPMTEWRRGVDMSLSGHAQGKIIILPPR